MGAWAWTARAWEIWCCHPRDSTRRGGTARRLLEGEGRREHGKGRRGSYTTARDGAALRRWMALRHEGYMMARDGRAQHVSTARDGAAASRRRGTARRYGDGRRVGTKATRRQGTAKHGKGRRDGYTMVRDGVALR